MKSDQDNSAVTRKLASFSANLHYAAIPYDVVEHIKLAVLDGLGCCLFGATLPWTEMVTQTVLADGGQPLASLFGRRDKAPLAGAALVNATAGHAFELDDIHRDSIIHPNSIAVPIALNLAEDAAAKGKPASGQQVITAIIAGYEVGNRIGMAAGTDLLLRGFHPQGTGGAIVAAVTAGRMMNLTADQMLQAIGIAGSLGAGLMAAQEGAMVKRLHSGRAAEAGVRAASLAAIGFTGIENLVEADYGGFLSSLAGRVDISEVCSGLGERWESAATGIKPYATVTSIHSCLDALSAIMTEQGLTADDIDRIEARISRATFVHCAWAYTGQSVTAAQMNLYYGLSMIALEGRAFADQFRPANIRSPHVMEFCSRISAVIDPDIEARGREFRHMGRLAVTTRDGKRFEREELHRRGSPENPVPAEDIRQKFREITAGVLTDTAISNTIDRINQLDQVTDVAELVADITTGLR